MNSRNRIDQTKYANLSKEYNSSMHRRPASAMFRKSMGLIEQSNGLMHQIVNNNNNNNNNDNKNDRSCSLFGSRNRSLY